MTRLLPTALLAALLLRAPAALAQDLGPVRITFLDVGQGDAVLVQAPEGQTALVDAGPGVDVVPLLATLGVQRLDLVVASHPHADHIGGMIRVLDALPVRFFMDGGEPHTTQTYLALVRALAARPDVTYLEAAPRTLSLGSVQLEVLPLPPPTGDLNNRSVALVLRLGAFVAFLSGDSERAELGHFLTLGVVPDVTLLKAPHHGADNGFTEPFLAAARPEVVVISVGDNGYGHPGPAALLAYASVPARVYRTDLHGTVSVLGFADGGYRVEAGREAVAGRPPVPLPAATPAPPASVPAPGAAGAPLTLGVFADAPGNDHRNLNGEYAFLRSASSLDLPVGGWTLCDAVLHCFRFPEGTVLRAGGELVVFTGAGVADGVRFFMGSGSAVWNNDGDTATLTDAEGRVVARHVYD